MSAVAKVEPPRPSCKPTATAREVTVAECDEGMPPDPTSCFKSQRCSLYLHIYQIILRLLRRISNRHITNNKSLTTFKVCE